MGAIAAMIVALLWPLALEGAQPRREEAVRPPRQMPIAITWQDQRQPDGRYRVTLTARPRAAVRDFTLLMQQRRGDAVREDADGTVQTDPIRIERPALAAKEPVTATFYLRFPELDAEGDPVHRTRCYASAEAFTIDDPPRPLHGRSIHGVPAMPPPPAHDGAAPRPPRDADGQDTASEEDRPL